MDPFVALKMSLKVNYNLNISYGSVRSMLVDDQGKKFIRCRRTQRLTAGHKENMVVTAKYWRQKYGIRPSAKRYKWDRIIISDFSAPVRCRRKPKKQNDGVWIDMDAEMNGEGVKSIINAEVEKYDPGLTLFGAICSEGLLPKGSCFFLQIG